MSIALFRGHRLRQATNSALALNVVVIRLVDFRKRFSFYKRAQLRPQEWRGQVSFRAGPYLAVGEERGKGGPIYLLNLKFESLYIS